MKLVSYMLTIVIALTLGCSAAQKTQAKQVTYACATVDIGRTVPEVGMTIFQDVMAVIQAGADKWEGKLAEIGIRYGEDSLACAAKAVYDALTPQGQGLVASAPSAGAARAKSFIETRSYQYR